MSYLKAIGMGVVAGLRSMTAPAQVSHHLANTDSSALAGTPLAFMAKRDVAAGFTGLALGEMVADKLPIMPNRTDPPGLIGRALSGALVGAALCTQEKKCAWTGAVLGSASAVAATFAAYHLRKEIGELGVPDLLVAVGEDVLAVSTGQCVLTSPATE
jgi:uncharacterized membrane protein